MKTFAPILAVAVVALGAAGCGGTTNAAPPPPPPKLPRALAQSWAQQADAIASSLAARDGCTAKAQAIALQTEILRVTSERRIAQRLAARLVDTVDNLPRRIGCTPAPPEPPAPHGPGHRDKPHKDHHGRHGGNGP